MANVDSAHGFICEGSFGTGGAVPTWKGRVKAGQTFVIGDPVAFSSGQLRIATITDPIAGVAAENCASLTAATEVKYIPAFPWIVFSGQTSGAFTNARLMSLCDIEGSTGIFEVNEDAVTYGTIRIIGKKDVGNTSLGTWCEVLFIFQRTKLAPFYYTTPTV